jgi:dolichyl-phosphate beta-glucosyltransferase
VTSEPVAFAFKDPFISRWVFDVAIIARLIVRTHVNAHVAIYEYPLLEWQDVRGSKIGLRDFWLALWDLGRIYFKYFRS